MSKHTVTFEIDTTELACWTDEHLAALWHVAQANPASGFDSAEPGRLAEAIGREIIRRFLVATPPALYNHQGHHFSWGKMHLPAEPAPVDADALGQMLDDLPCPEVGADRLVASLEATSSTEGPSA